LKIMAAPFIFYSMKMYRPLRTGLFVYECARLVFLLGAFMALRPDEGTPVFPWLACAAPNALFPLMTLFLLLDGVRYSGYAPLYAAGKCVSFIATALWCVFFQQQIITAILLDDTIRFMAPGIGGILIIGDMLSVAAGLIIIKKAQMLKARTLGPPAAVLAQAPVGGE
jgi:hypothetical protein